ncbi:U7 snRNA-associated Sm-like protein LSm11 [Drosophila eugracilis]|uniref:U7 snRNA-associated Sm-like protein LSm11 n=1 Tax=Drosophila eugracilis TaxID=29029 RepID=UPI0007E5DEF6|nr:U7 snRNA-associated Sm-like protein LSm11 [Drosophila eugracilis]
MTDSESKDQKGSNKDDPELDVCSDIFNPLRALYEPNYRVTNVVPKVLYQNLAAFESALKKFGIWQLNKRQKPDAGNQEAVKKASSKLTDISEVPQRRFEPHQMPTTSTSSKKHHRNIFTYMETTVGPLELLKKCVTLSSQKETTDRIRVRVVIRKQGSLGGSVEGELVAFDKQWNLLLRKATETWKRRKYNYGEQNICDTPVDCTDRLRELGISLPKTQVKSLDRKNVELKRELPQILIRGENVVLVSLIPKATRV